VWIFRIEIGKSKIEKWKYKWFFIEEGLIILIWFLIRNFYLYLSIGSTKKTILESKLFKEIFWE
jgi:hypothetical protein